MQKKAVVLLILMTLIFSLAAPVAAQEGEAQVSKEQALEIVKKRIEIPKNLKNQNIGFNEEGPRKVWNFNWSSEGRLYKSLSVGVDAVTGDIISYSYHEFDPRKGPIRSTQGLPKPIDEDKAREAALEFFKKVQPDKVSQIRQGDQPYLENPYPSLGPKVYNFYYERVVDGIPFPENSVNIAVNGHTGKVESYYLNWDKVVFPKVEKPVDPQQIEKTLREATEFELKYIPPYSFGSLMLKNKEIELYYEPGGFQYPIVEAATGKLIDRTGKELTLRDKVYQNFKPISANTSKEAPAADNKKAISLEEAKNKALAFIDGDYKLESSRLSDMWGQGKFYEFTFLPKDREGSFSNINIRINAVTGELHSFDNWGRGSWGRSEDQKPQYTWEQGKKIATEFVLKAFPLKGDKLVTTEKDPNEFSAYGYQPPAYGYIFFQSVNDIPFYGNQINIQVDNITGKVNFVWVNWQDGVKFLSPGNAITAQEAEDRYFSTVKPRLIYARKYSKDMVDFSKPAEVMLVYAANNGYPLAVNALSGNVEPPFLPKGDVKLDDIKDHWAAPEISFLAMQGIVSGYDNRFNPDKPITRAEFVKYLVAAKGLESVKPTGDQLRFSDVPASAWYYGYVEAAAQAGIIKGTGNLFNPEGEISRQEMAVMVIRALGTEEQSEIELDFKDQAKIAPWAKDAVALAIEMELLKGNDGYFKPEKIATRAEAAVLVARAMNLLATRSSYGFAMIGG